MVRAHSRARELWTIIALHTGTIFQNVQVLAQT